MVTKVAFCGLEASVLRAGCDSQAAFGLHDNVLSQIHVET